MPEQTINICGYLVVRKPQHNFRGAPRSEKAPEVGGVCYEGVNRIAWEDIAGSYYQHILLTTIHEQFRDILEQPHNARFDHGLLICKDLDQSYQLLQYCNRKEPLNELIAVYSRNLAGITGTIQVNRGLVEWIGYDLVQWGEISLLEEGYFVAPTHFLECEDFLNERKLVVAPDQSIIDTFARVYNQAAEARFVERNPVDRIEAFSVGRVDLDMIETAAD